MDNIVSFTALVQQLFSADYWQWHIATIVLFTIIINQILKVILNSLLEKSAKTETYWDDTLLSTAYMPLRLAVWLMGISLILQILKQHFDFEHLHMAYVQFRKLAFIGLIALLLYRLIGKIHAKYQIDIANNKSKLDATSLEAISKLLRVSVVIIAALICLQALGYSISGVLAFGGVGGIAIGFAARDLLANFFGGMMIYLDKPFKVGDWVRSPDRNIEGTVEKIGWRTSKIRTFDKRPLYIPNSLFTTIIVENPSRMSHRRINETIGLRYDDWDKVAPIVQDVKDMLRNHPEIDSTQTLICNFNTFNSSSLDFFVYTFTKTVNWVKYHEVKEDVLLKIFAIISAHGAEIAFPTQTLHHIEQNNEPMTNPLTPDMYHKDASHQQ